MGAITAAKMPSKTAMEAVKSPHAKALNPRSYATQPYKSTSNQQEEAQRASTSTRRIPGIK